MQAQIARKTEKFINSLGLHVEKVKKANRTSAMAFIEDSRSQAVKALKRSGAKNPTH